MVFLVSKSSRNEIIRTFWTFGENSPKNEIQTCFSFINTINEVTACFVSWFFGHPDRIHIIIILDNFPMSSFQKSCRKFLKSELFEIVFFKVKKSVPDFRRFWFRLSTGFRSRLAWARKTKKSWFIKWPRLLLDKVNSGFCSRLLGGYSLIVLTKWMC